MAGPRFGLGPEAFSRLATGVKSRSLTPGWSVGPYRSVGRRCARDGSRFTMLRMSEALRYQALLLAGSRGGSDPLLEGTGCSHKALLPVGGVPMLERSIHKRRPDYVAYAARTSAFFPRPPKTTG